MERETKLEIVVVSILSIVIGSLIYREISLLIAICSALAGLLMYYTFLKPGYNQLFRDEWDKQDREEDEKYHQQAVEILQNRIDKQRMAIEEADTKLLGEDEIIDNPEPREKEKDNIDEL